MFCRGGFPRPPAIYGYRAREGTETLPYNTRHKIMLLYYFFPINRKPNERESRALWSGLQSYSALNKFAGSRSTSLCADRSDGWGFQRGRPPQWSGPFGKYKNSASCCFGYSCQQQVYTSANGALGESVFSPLNYYLSPCQHLAWRQPPHLFIILYSLFFIL